MSPEKSNIDVSPQKVEHKWVHDTETNPGFPRRDPASSLKQACCAIPPSVTPSKWASGEPSLRTRFASIPFAVVGWICLDSSRKVGPKECLRAHLKVWKADNLTKVPQLLSVPSQKDSKGQTENLPATDPFTSWIKHASYEHVLRLVQNMNMANVRWEGTHKSWALEI